MWRSSRLAGLLFLARWSLLRSKCSVCAFRFELSGDGAGNLRCCQCRLNFGRSLLSAWKRTNLKKNYQIAAKKGLKGAVA